MDLFRSRIDQPANFLPSDGVANYHGIIIDIDSADNYFAKLLSQIEWKHDEANIFGKRIITKRKVAWYADAPYPYTYSNATRIALPWTQDLLSLKETVEQATGDTFNACLLNLYHDGSEGMAWHSDAEKDLQRHASIASLSLGAERKFSFKHKKNKASLSLVLEHGSLIVMKGITQQHWLHRLPPTKLCKTARVNLTFRTVNKAPCL